MTVSIDHFLADIGDERRASIEAAAAEIVAEQQTLAALRRARGLTQAQVATAMETSQANVAQIERKGDSLVSTVARVVQALGGELEMSARFTDGTIVPLQVGPDGNVRERPRVASSVPQISQAADPGRPTGLNLMKYNKKTAKAMAAAYEIVEQFKSIRGSARPDLHMIGASGPVAGPVFAELVIDRPQATGPAKVRNPDLSKAIVFETRKFSTKAFEAS